MAESTSHEIGKEEISWDEMKCDRRVRGLQLRADPAHKCPGLAQPAGEVPGGSEEAEIRGRGGMTS